MAPQPANQSQLQTVPSKVYAVPRKLETWCEPVKVQSVQVYQPAQEESWFESRDEAAEQLDE
jgi:hypothetical protein